MLFIIIGIIGIIGLFVFTYFDEKHYPSGWED